MRTVIAAGFAVGLAALSLTGFAGAQEKQNIATETGAPPKSDAEPVYWTNLFENTFRFTVLHPAGPEDVDVFYNRGKTVSTNTDLKGAWSAEGEPGAEIFCYTLGPFKSEPRTLSECFPLKLMNNPRAGARWSGKMKPNVNYKAEVVAGRSNAPK